MPVIINGSTGISGVDGTAASPAIEGSDTNTGMFFPAADTIAFSEGGIEVLRMNSSTQIEFLAGTASLPTITASGDLNSGIFFPAADTIGFSTAAAERMRIDSSGNVLVTGSGGLGYGTGSGGTVTQATSKATAVTINKPTGQITMNNAALAANAAVSFSMNNSFIAAADTVLISLSSPASAAYNIWIGFTGAGQAAIVVQNISAGSLSQALVLNFAIIKGATS